MSRAPLSPSMVDLANSLLAGPGKREPVITYADRDAMPSYDSDGKACYGYCRECDELLERCVVVAFIGGLEVDGHFCCQNCAEAAARATVIVEAVR